MSRDINNRTRKPWRLAGITNLTSRLYSPLVSLTNGQIFHTVRLDIGEDGLRGMSLKQIEVIAIGLMNLNRGNCSDDEVKAAWLRDILEDDEE